MRKSIKLVFCVIFGIFGCGEDIEEEAGPDMSECDRDAVEDWGAEEALSWDAALPIQDKYNDFETLIVEIEGEYALKSSAGKSTLTISKSTKVPYQSYEVTICRRIFNMPVALELTYEDIKWEGTFDLWAAAEHVGYVTGREVPDPFVSDPLGGVVQIETDESFPSFGREDERPSVRADETRLGYVVVFEITADKRVSLKVIANDTLTKNGVSGYESKPWFTLEGEKVE